MQDVLRTYKLLTLTRGVNSGRCTKVDAILKALQGTPIPTILVVAGIVFLLLAIAGQLAGRIAVAPERQRWAALIGGGLLAIGLALHIVPLLQSQGTPPPVKEVPPTGPSTPPVQKPPSDAIVSPPPSGSPVQSYRISTDYVMGTNVEFSVFINDVPVGAYSSSGVTADITRFIKPGANKVRIAWKTAPSIATYATLKIEAKQGDSWSPLITRTVLTFPLHH
jgi:hypothetical protein